MNITRKLPIGVQSFKVLRNDCFVYVDKTAYLAQLITGGRVYFLSRPRRFGKSLFLSTLAAYFRGQKELFKDLYIEQAEEEQAAQENRAPWQAYPVLYFDFNTGQYDTIESLISRIELFLSPLEKKYAILSVQGDLAQRLEEIIKQIYETTHKQVVILIDEYDKPLLQTMSVNEELNEKYRTILKAFYSVIKTCDQYIRFAFLTGVTKFSKISIFSDLNNLRDISMEKQYADLLKLREQNYQTAVYLIFALMGQFVQTEVHCYSTATDGGGRIQKQVFREKNLSLSSVHGRTLLNSATDGGGSMQQRCFGGAETRSQNYTRMYSFGVADCMVITADTVYIFEFKLSDNGSAEDALAQIKKNRYAEQYKADGKKIVLVGSSFDEEKRTIKERQIANG